MCARVAAAWLAHPSARPGRAVTLAPVARRAPAFACCCVPTALRSVFLPSTVARAVTTRTVQVRVPLEAPSGAFGVRQLREVLDRRPGWSGGAERHGVTVDRLVAGRRSAGSPVDAVDGPAERGQLGVGFADQPRDAVLDHLRHGAASAGDDGRAADVRARTLRDFWQPDLGTFALALTFDDLGQARPARVVASRPGHLLASRLLDGDDVAPIRARLIARLFGDDLLAGAGIRTRAVGSARFRAGSYHNGSTWPVDTGVIADGLRRHGEAATADELERRVLAGCAAVGGFPEFFRGDPDGRLAVNTTTLDQIVDGVLNRLEQPPRANQGWTVTRVWRSLRRRGTIDVAAVAAEPAAADLSAPS